ncbi:MAG: crotonase [Actinobacteria bacterium RBG_16_64_13]|nr:MAG: crotonase [Actinobacteria bacterium RBG_16_64_13]
MYVEVKKDDGVALLTINRPEALNAMNVAMLEELCAALERIESDDEVRVLVVTGAGRAFVAGADIDHMSRFSPQQAKEWSKFGQRTVGKLESMRKPVIAAVNGYALGGGTELAMACDIRVASDRAVFGQPEVKLGMIAGFGGTQRLPRLVGPGMAKEMLFTGDHYDAEAACKMGLVNKVVPADELLDYCLGMARRIAGRGTQAVRLSKEAVNHGQDLDLENALGLESELYGLAFATDEPREGCSAFLEKREPKWTSS